MALCAYCRKETDLYHGGTAICVECAEAPASQRSIAYRLEREVAAATARAEAANAAFHALMREIPSSVPQPDGSQRLHNASHELTIARRAVTEAALRLNNFLNYGTLPEDVNR
ncbi:MAG: hypothetical protein M3O20_16525 [Acidobacteriota bacterium]|nr:hypothetical protein [Acidobacteriota bacterium]